MYFTAIGVKIFQPVLLLIQTILGLDLLHCQNLVTIKENTRVYMISCVHSVSICSEPEEV